MTGQEKTKVAIVGAGPAGATLATLCARDGMRVDLFESQAETSRTVGESLLPYGHRMWKRLGLDLGAEVVKPGAAFFGHGHGARIDFGEAQNCPYKSAYQVDRLRFDAQLRNLAVEAGAELRVEHLKEVPAGYDWVVDASGRRRCLARQWTTFERHPLLSNIARGTHYRGARLPSLCQTGDIALVAEEGLWFWVIPVGDGVMSVGVVLTAKYRQLSLDEAIGRSSLLRECLRGAERIGPVRGYADYSEAAESFHGLDSSGARWAAVGDAALFLDPVFSSGVLFAMEGAERLHRVITRELGAEEYESQMRSAGAMIRTVIEAFYEGEFLNLVFSPRELQSPIVRSGLVGLLAGNLFEDSGRAEKVVAAKLRDFVDLIRGQMGADEFDKAPQLYPQGAGIS